MKADWKVSLHGGHSIDFCEHAHDKLSNVLDAAVKFGYHTFGVSEHAPRLDKRFLYPSEIKKGFTVDRLVDDFEKYASAINELSEEYSDRLVVLRGFETEIVPHENYIEIMKGLREKHKFDYMVGSVHHVGLVNVALTVDSSPAEYKEGVDHFGGIEPLAIHYYETVAKMVEDLEPEVVGHFDLIRKNAASYGPVDTPPIRKIAEETLQVIKEKDCILDLNTAGIRKGLGSPYPAQWVLELAKKMEIGFCFGDDSHKVADVGAGVDEAREYLMSNGISSVTILTKEGSELLKKIVSL